MTDYRMDDPLKAFETVLEQERRAILDGDFDTLAKLFDRKRDLLKALRKDMRNERPEFERLRGTAMRNQELLDKALDGIRAVADRVAEIRAAERQLDTYDSQGFKKTYPTETRSVERRA